MPRPPPSGPQACSGVAPLPPRLHFRLPDFARSTRGRRERTGVRNERPRHSPKQQAGLKRLREEVALAAEDENFLIFRASSEKEEMTFSRFFPRSASILIIRERLKHGE